MNLVTGGSGLLGQQVIKKLLALQQQVVAIYHHTPIPISNPNLTLIQANLLDVVALDAAMQGITAVYHCAALVSFNPADRENLYKTNVEGTANIVNIALANNVHKLVYVSSVAALGRHKDNPTIDETLQWVSGGSYYGQSKHLGEMEVWRGIAEGLNAVIVNPSIILGEADWNSSSTQLFKTVYNQLGWYTTGTNGWVDVQDVAEAMLQLMQSPITDERFIVSGSNQTYQTIFNTIAKAFNKKAPNKKVTPLVAAVLWRLAKLKALITNKQPLITKETAHTALTTTYYNNEKLLKALPGFTYTPLQISIQRICNYLLETK